MWQCKSWIIDETTIPFNTGVTRWQNSENSVCYTWSLLLLIKLSTFTAIEFSLLLRCTIGTITLHQMWCNADLFVMAFYQYKKSTQLHTTFFLNIFNCYSLKPKDKQTELWSSLFNVCVSSKEGILSIALINLEDLQIF